MSDLISRKEALELIDISFIIPILKMNLRPEHEAVLKIREIIMNMPTAFDKEKVIEELREMQSHSKLCKNQCGFTSTEYFDYMGAEVAYGTAIEIVEKGGTE